MIRQNNAHIDSQVGELTAELDMIASGANAAVGVMLSDARRIIITEVGFTLFSGTGATTSLIRRATTPAETINFDSGASGFTNVLTLPAAFESAGGAGHRVHRPKGGILTLNKGDSDWGSYVDDFGLDLLGLQFQVSATALLGRLWMKYKAFYDGEA